jgi:SecD/SecF fusion protein
MDFTGGYAVTVQLPVSPEGTYRARVEQALMSQGASLQDIQVRELSPPHNVRILLSRNLEQPGHPLYALPTRATEVTYPYEHNPQLVWVVNGLRSAGLAPGDATLKTLDTHWTQVSGQMSDTMRTHALIGLVAALTCVLLYITFRFEWKYACSATICLAHDLLFTLGVIALLHACGVELQIDLTTLAALLTIVGYSLNDTIIIFDRIREEVRHKRFTSFAALINHALHVTLSRTMMTSGITLLVLVPLILLGGHTLFGFALVIAIGVIFGTLSSLFIAAPLMKVFHDREERENTTLIATHE